jgi:flagellar protein FlaJ
MLVVEYKFIPQMLSTISTSTSGIGTGGIPGLGKGLGSSMDQKVISNLFFGLILIQGFFAGLVIGKLSEGRIQPGLKHSFILTAIAYLMTTFVGIFVK